MKFGFVESRRCSDHGCILGHPGGRGTNGGCRHDKMNKIEIRRELRAVAVELRALLKE